MLYSFHTHAFPDSLAPRAMAVLERESEKLDVQAHTDGTLEGAQKHLEHAGIGGALICNIATNAHQMHKVNDFALSIQKESFFFQALGSLHPDGEDLEAELLRLKDAGIKGIKIHPDYVDLMLNGPEFDQIFSLCEKHNMFVISHMGLDPKSPNLMHATPKMAMDVKSRHPDLTFVCAHMGGLDCRQEAIDFLCGEDIYLDTSLCSFVPSDRPLLEHIFEKHRGDRLLFATDTPWTSADDEVTFFQSLQLDSKTYDLISYQNAFKLLGKDILP